jgi:hypothetical protein
MEHKCLECKKNYASYKSLWNHNAKYHKNIVSEIVSNLEKIKKKFICDKCNEIFFNLEKITDHCKNDCRPSVKSNNIYTFKTDTFGKNKYKLWKGGDIYIIQTEFNLKGFYKIGITTNLYQRLNQYRCGAVLEPKLHYYYPCKNIKKVDKILKDKLKKFKIKREIYKSDNINDFRNLIKEIQKESDSYEIEIIPENKQCDIKGCDYCNLYFTNHQDLLIHIQKLHNVSTPVSECSIFKCIKCNEKFNSRTSKWRHEKMCENKISNNEEINLIKKENLEIKKEIEKLKEMLQKSLNIHPMNNNEMKGIKKEEIKLVLYNNLAKIKNNNPDIIKIEDKEMNI